MHENKEKIVTAISRARRELDGALEEIEKMGGVDPGAVAFVAHALGNYLTVVGGTIELALIQLRGQVDAPNREWLEGARHATELMGPLVSQLRSLGAGTGEMKLRLDRVDLASLVDRCCDYYRRVAKRKEISITMSSGSGIAAVWTDSVAVAVILDNLLSNAVKYSTPGKTIRVEVQGEPDSAICSVSDEGPGLSLEDHGKLFQRGARLTPRPTGMEESSGYGLAVAKELVEKLGGTIWCESVLGQGSRFLFRLPSASTS